MEQFIMKKLFSILFISVILTTCTDDRNKTQRLPKPYTENTFKLVQTVTLEIPRSKSLRTSNSNQTNTISGQITVVMNSDNEELTEIIIDQKILSAIKMSQHEFNRAFNHRYKTKLDNTKSMASWFAHFVLLLQDQDQPAIQDNDESLSDCIIKCHREFTDENGKRIRGRGACKAGCWFDAAKELVVNVAEAVF